MVFSKPNLEHGIIQDPCFGLVDWVKVALGNHAGEAMGSRFGGLGTGAALDGHFFRRHWIDEMVNLDEGGGWPFNIEDADYQIPGRTQLVLERGLVGRFLVVRQPAHMYLLAVRRQR